MAGEHYRYIQGMLEHAQVIAAQRVVPEVSLEEALMLKGQATAVVYEVFWDLLNNDPRYAKYAYRTVDIKELGWNRVKQDDLTQMRMRWGNKFEPTEEEKAMLYHFSVESSSITSGTVPDAIKKEDFSVTHWIDLSSTKGVIIRHAPMEVYDHRRSSWVTVTHESFDPAVVIQTPQALYPAIIRLTQNELRTVTTLTKGRDYWKPLLGKRTQNRVPGTSM